MSSNLELQEEELEVLNSIYDGDENFKQISSGVFQYKVGNDGDKKSFLLEVSWDPDYPTKAPTINLDAFYNKHLSQSTKSFIAEKLNEQMESLLGMAMTYSLFELCKESLDEMMSKQDENECSMRSVPVDDPSTNDRLADTHTAQPSGKIKEKKVQLTKAQKRRQYNQQDINGERPRGWDWVDIVKHLSQTGRSAQNLQQEKIDKT